MVLLNLNPFKCCKRAFNEIKMNLLKVDLDHITYNGAIQILSLLG